MQYNPTSQGFSVNPGGVPYNGTPTHPNIAVDPIVQPHLGELTALLANDMASRGTSYTQYMSGLYSQNGYDNDLMAHVLKTAADYATYLMDTRRVPFSQITQEVVVTTNNTVLDYQYRKNPQSIPTVVTDAEIHRYRTATSEISQIRHKIVEHMKQKENNMFNNFNNNTGFNSAGFNNTGFNANSQMSPAMQHLLTAPAHIQQMAMNMMQQGWSAEQILQALNNQQNNTQPFNNMGGGFNTMGMTAEQMQLLREQQNEAGWQARRQRNAAMQQGMFGTGNAVTNAMPMNMGNTMAPAMSGSSMNTMSNFATPANNTNQFSGIVATPSKPFNGYTSIYDNSNSGGSKRYTGEPTVSKESLAALNGGESDVMASIARNSQRMYKTQPTVQTQPQPQTLDQSVYSDDGKKYVLRLREACRNRGLPYEDVSVSYMESALSAVDPNNGVVSPNSAYSEVKNVKVGNVTGTYGASYDKEVEEMMAGATTTNLSFSDMVREITDNKNAGGKLIQQPDGSRKWVKNEAIQNFNSNNPNLDINNTYVDFQGNVNKPKAPYDFARQSVTGDWVIDAADHKHIPGYKRGIFFNPATYLIGYHEAYYIVDAEGDIVEFFTRQINSSNKKGNNVDFNLHDTERFFKAMTKKDEKHQPNTKQLLDTFANLQTEQKVKEVIEDLEKQAGIVDGDDENIIIDQTIELENEVFGGYVGDDYYNTAYDALRVEMGDQEYELENVAIHYRHVFFNPWLLKGNDFKLARGMRHNDDYLEIASVLNRMADDETIPASWFTRLNDMATRYLNKVINVDMGLPEYQKITLDSFCLDIEEVIEDMNEKGYGKRFMETASGLTDSLLYLWNKNNSVFTDYFTIDAEELEEGNVGAFAVVRDVSVLPVHSRDIPLSGATTAVLTRDGFPALWNIAHERMNTKTSRVSEVLFVTKDNRHMYINESGTKDVYIITKKSMFE